MTDALARQQIQRWTTQLVAPEYVGAHVSAPTSHTTHRTLPLDFRAATALFGAFGIEWDLTEASSADLDSLAAWIERFKRFRPLLHSGRVVRPESSDPAVLLHGVVARDGSRGAGRARPARRVRAQPRRAGPRARPRPRGPLRADVGGPGRRAGDEHVGAAARERPDRRAAGEWRRARASRVLDAADAAGDGDAVGLRRQSGSLGCERELRLRRGLSRDRPPLRRQLRCRGGQGGAAPSCGRHPWVVLHSGRLRFSPHDTALPPRRPPFRPVGEFPGRRPLRAHGDHRTNTPHGSRAVDGGTGVLSGAKRRRPACATTHEQGPQGGAAPPCPPEGTTGTPASGRNPSPPQATNIGRNPKRISRFRGSSSACRGWAAAARRRCPSAPCP